MRIRFRLNMQQTSVFALLNVKTFKSVSYEHAKHIRPILSVPFHQIAQNILQDSPVSVIFCFSRSINAHDGIKLDGCSVILRRFNLKRFGNIPVIKQVQTRNIEYFSSVQAQRLSRLFFGELQRQNAIDQMTEKSELLTIRMQSAWNDVNEAFQQLLIAERSIEQAKENLRLNRDYYNAGISKMSDLLEAQLLYQQALDSRTDAFVAYQIIALKYRQATAQ